MDQLIDMLDIAAKNHPIKALASDLGKGESTLRNELTQQPGYKLGLVTAIQIIKMTDDIKPLDRIESFFGRVAFDLPKPEPGNMRPCMEFVGKLSKEFSEVIEEMATALLDGVMTGKEAKRCLNETCDLIKACVKLKAYLRQYIKIKEN